MVLQNDQKSYAEFPDIKLFSALAESLKQPLGGISRTAELLSLHIEDYQTLAPGLLNSIVDTSAQTVRLLDHYLLCLRLQQAQTDQLLAPVSVAAILTDIAHRLEVFAHKQQCDLELVINGRYEPVLANGAGLTAALFDIGLVLLEGQLQQTDDHVRRRSVLKLATHRTRHGIVAGLFTDLGRLHPSTLNRARKLQGRAAAPFNQYTVTSTAGLFIADSLLKTMSGGLRVARFQRASGLATTLTPSGQLSIV